MPPKNSDYMRDYMRRYRADRRLTPKPRKCEHCSEVFTPKRDDARYCSDACCAAARRKRFDIALDHNPAGWTDGAPTPAVSAARRRTTPR